MLFRSNYVTTFSKDDYLLILTDLFTTETIDGKEEKKLVLQKDQIVILTDEKEVDSKLSICDGKAEWNVPKGSVRKITYNEEWDADTKHKMNVIDFEYAKYKDNKVNDITSTKKDDKEEEEDDIDDTDDTIYVDGNILINNDFLYIKERINEIISNIHNVSIFNVKDYLRDLEAHIDNCIDEYTEIAAEQGVIFYEDDKQLVNNKQYDGWK